MARKRTDGTRKVAKPATDEPDDDEPDDATIEHWEGVWEQEARTITRMFEARPENMRKGFLCRVQLLVLMDLQRRLPGFDEAAFLEKMTPKVERK